MQADRPYVAYREIAPPDEGGGQGLADFTGPQPQKAISSTPPEGIGQPCRYLLVQDGRLDHCARAGGVGVV